MEIFENVDLPYLCGRTKTKVFKDDEVGKNISFRKYPASCGGSNTIRKR